MPELPEVEVIRRDLEKEVVGKKVKAVDVAGMRSIRRYRQRKQFTGARFFKLRSSPNEMFLRAADGVEMPAARDKSAFTRRLKTHAFF